MAETLNRREKKKKERINRLHVSPSVASWKPRAAAPSPPTHPPTQAGAGAGAAAAGLEVRMGSGWRSCPAIATQHVPSPSLRAEYFMGFNTCIHLQADCWMSTPRGLDHKPSCFSPPRIVYMFFGSKIQEGFSLNIFARIRFKDFNHRPISDLFSKKRREKGEG